jgi:hypothetical protein
VAGIHREAEAAPVRDGGMDALKLRRLRGGVVGLCIAAGVQLHQRRAAAACRVELARVGIDEQRYLHAGHGELRDGLPDTAFLTHHVEAAFGGQLRAPLGYKATVRRPQARGDADHLVRDRHFEVQTARQAFAQRPHVGVLDVPAVLAQVHGDEIGAARQRLEGSIDGRRIRGVARLAQRRDVVDVDAEQRRGGCVHAESGSVCARPASARNSARLFRGRSPKCQASCARSRRFNASQWA